jgi:hypothetical protein
MKVAPAFVFSVSKRTFHASTDKYEFQFLDNASWGRYILIGFFKKRNKKLKGRHETIILA